MISPRIHLAGWVQVDGRQVQCVPSYFSMHEVRVCQTCYIEYYCTILFRTGLDFRFRTGPPPNFRRAGDRSPYLYSNRSCPLPQLFAKGLREANEREYGSRSTTTTTTTNRPRYHRMDFCEFFRLLHTLGLRLKFRRDSLPSHHLYVSSPIRHRRSSVSKRCADVGGYLQAVYPRGSTRMMHKHRGFARDVTMVRPSSLPAPPSRESHLRRCCGMEYELLPPKPTILPDRLAPRRIH